MESNHLLSIVTFFPLAGGLLVLLVGKESGEAIRRMALVTSGATFFVSLLLLRSFDAARPGYQLEELHPWMANPRIQYHLGMDGISLMLVLLTTFLTPLAVLASWKSIQTRMKGFFLMLLALETAMIGVFFALDLFLFFLFWEAMLIPMYFLIGIWGHERRIYAAIKFVLYTMTGSILMLVAIVWLYSRSGTFDLPTIQTLLQEGVLRLGQREEMLLFGAFFLAFAIKVPLFPLHTWLPDAHVEAPTAGSVILAGVLLKMGTYGLVRFCLPLFPDASHRFAPWIAGLAIVGIIYGALLAMVQPDYKKLVAYSSVSHLGFVVLGIFVFNQVGMQGAVYQMLNHGVSTGGLFLVAGILYDRRHTHLIQEFGGLATPMPVFSSFFLLIVLSSLGLPLLNGFVGEFLILTGTFASHTLWAALAATGVILSAVYLLWSYQRVIYGEVTVEKNRALPDASPRERSILAAVCAMILVMGVASPFFLRRTEASSARIFREMQRPFQYLAGGKPGSGAAPLRAAWVARGVSEREDAARKGGAPSPGKAGRHK